MDFSGMTDAELDELQLQVNIEIGARLQKSRMMRRMADVMGEASAAGIPDEDIATSFTAAKERANIRYVPLVPDIEVGVADNTPAVPRAPRTASGFRDNTID
ncbi:hypothetical protein SEA_BRUHMOMENT_40 [Arthrobacter phage BruhMoment]|nr:hypothetical protein SEA_BRUHMOMENT_40 [Arthrobacter phage BruhMoment]